MKAAASLVLLAACYGGGYDVFPQTTGGDCYSLDCPVMAGGELRLYAGYYDDTGQHPEVPQLASVSPPELGDVAIDGDAMVLHASGKQPLASGGLGVLHVELASGGVIDRDFTVRPAASLAIVADASAVPVDLFPERRLPGERLAMFAGSTLGLHAAFLDADGNLVLGHDGSAWTATNLELADAAESDPLFDATLARVVRGNVAGSGSVAFGGAAFPIDVVQEHTTARIEAHGVARKGDDQAVHLYPGEYTSLTVLAYASDGRFIFGGPPFVPLTVTSSDPDVVGIQPISSYSRTFGVNGYRSGTATLTISFDNQTIAVPANVE